MFDEQYKFSWGFCLCWDLSQWNSTESISITVITCTPQLHSLMYVNFCNQLWPVGLAHCVSLLAMVHIKTVPYTYVTVVMSATDQPLQA